MTQVLNADGSISDVEVSTSPDLYFILEAQTEDWEYMIQMLITHKEKLETRDAFLQLDPTMKQFPKFYLSKEKFTAAEIAKLIGYPHADLSVFDNVEVIHLKPIGDQKAWEKPTVPYIGGA